MTTHLANPAALSEHVGSSLGTSDWITITQQQVDAFADATGDHQWIHTDPVRAAAGPFGGPIAHGYLTLSLIPVVLEQVLTFDDLSQIVNYGLDKARFPAPVPVGSQLRAEVVLTAAPTRPNGMVEAHMSITFERQGGDRPPAIAETIFLYA